MRLLLLLILSACGATTTTRSASELPATPKSEGIEDVVQSFFEAVDERDAAKFKALTASGFLLFEDGKATSAERLVGYWEGSTSPTRRRVCKNETIRRSGSVIVYTGDCTEKVSKGEGKAKTTENWQGWNTVVLAQKDTGWTVALWQWQRSGIAGERIRWNDAYRRGNSFSKQPTPFLLESIKGEKAGRALVLAMGQGRNALYLASKGWQVTGVDISEIGIAEARVTAEQSSLSLEAVVADINEYPFGEERWDLVTMLYAGGNVDWMKRAQAALAPGGIFVLEHFHSEPGADNWSVSLSPEDFKRLFLGWEILENQVVEDRAEWGMTSAPLLRFSARKR